MKAQAYLFDMDGTLIDTEVIWVEATAQYLAACRVQVTAEQVQRIVYGRSWRDVHADVAALDPKLALPIDVMQARMDPYFKRLREARDVRIPSSIECLRRCAMRAPVCVVSGSSRTDVDGGIAVAGIGERLAFSLAADDYHPGKPDPACYTMAVEKLGVDPARCVVFEDSRAGILAARRAGCKAIALKVAGRPEQDLSQAHQILTDLADYDEAALFAQG